MDAIHGKVGLPNFVVSQPGHVRQHPDTIDRFAEKPCGGYLWTSRTDVSHEVSVDPVDDAGIDISYLEQRWNLWVSGTAIHPDHVSHAPGTIRVSNDHGHSCFDVQENGIRLGRCNGARMINRHTPLASTAVLVQE